MKKLTTILISGLLIASAAACTNTARTSADAPATDETTTAPDTSTAQDTDEDATDDLRQRQLESDIRAREERNDITGGDADRAEGDLASEVRSKLEANLPASLLTVEAEDGAVNITGTVPTQEQFDRIEPLAREIKGVQSVSVDVDITPAQPEG